MEGEGLLIQNKIATSDVEPIILRYFSQTRVGLEAVQMHQYYVLLHGVLALQWSCRALERGLRKGFIPPREVGTSCQSLTFPSCNAMC